MQRKLRRLILSTLVATLYLAPLAASLSAHADEPLKIGFLVRMPGQAWFINGQKVATELGQKSSFSVTSIGAPSGEEALPAVDNLGAQGAKDFVICAPDMRLGPAISARTKHYNMKFVMVDDQLAGSPGKPLANVPYLGTSTFEIGNQVGQAISDEMKRRGWKPEEVDVLRITDCELPTAKLRTGGVTQTLLTDGFEKENILDMPQRTTDDVGGLDAALPVLAQYAEIKKWVIPALNEKNVLSGVCATEQLHIPAADMTGADIDGASEVFIEFQKKEQTGFLGTIAVSSANYGKESAASLVERIKTGEQSSVNTRTIDKLMVRSNWQKVRKELDI